MIKHVVINRLNDGLIFCQTNEGYNDTDLQNIKIKIKTYHKEVTAYSKQQSTPMKQIQNRQFGIFYRINSFVVFTVIVQQGYPLKLTNAFLDNIINSFFDQAKCSLGANDLRSRLESIQGSHYFVKFDRIIKQKKKQFEDPKTTKNTERMKKQLQNIHEIMRENMNMLDGRHQDLLNTQQKAKKVNQQAKSFHTNTKKLVWSLWFKKNLVWIVIVVTIIILGWCII